jgi:hypothetical protein
MDAGSGYIQDVWYFARDGNWQVNQKENANNALKCRSTLNELMLGPKGGAQDVRNK